MQGMWSGPEAQGRGLLRVLLLWGCAVPAYPIQRQDRLLSKLKAQSGKRQHRRRVTRLTNGHSKKIENHVHMVALYTAWYNFARINSSVRMSPAMAARVTDRLWDVDEIVKLIEDWEAVQ